MEDLKRNIFLRAKQLRRFEWGEPEPSLFSKNFRRNINHCFCISFVRTTDVLKTSLLELCGRGKKVSCTER